LEGDYIFLAKSVNPTPTPSNIKLKFWGDLSSTPWFSKFSFQYLPNAVVITLIFEFLNIPIKTYFKILAIVVSDITM